MILIALALVVMITLGLMALRISRAVAVSVRSGAEEIDMPKSMTTLSYVLLIVLMFGVVTGWLGGL